MCPGPLGKQVVGSEDPGKPPWPSPASADLTQARCCGLTDLSVVEAAAGVGINVYWAFCC